MPWEAQVLKDLALEGKAKLDLARTGSEVSSEVARPRKLSSSLEPQHPLLLSSGRVPR